MRFRDVIGQEAIKQKLVGLLQQDRLSHALLFLGKEGSGDLSLALAFAQYIVCTSSNKLQSEPSLFGEENTEKVVLPADSCGVCPACKKSAEFVHPDIHFTYPVVPAKAGDKPICTDYISNWREFLKAYPYGNVYDWLQFIGAENKQGNIPVKECDDISRKLSLKSFESVYKISIIWMPEYLGKEGNKLLKIIEEPPDNTIFLFVAHNEQAILQTILSRTQLIKIPLLQDNEMLHALIARSGADSTAAIEIVAAASGNYRNALQLLQHHELDWHHITAEWLKFINRQMYAEQVKWIDDISKLGREKQKQFLLYMINLFQRAIRSRILNMTQNLIESPTGQADFLNRLNKLCSIEAQQAILRQINAATYYIERNANPKLLFHALTIRIYHIIKDNSVILVN